MLKIIICDDDQFTLQLTSSLLERAISASKTEAKLVCITSTGGELLNYIQNTSDSYFYFLDFNFGKTELNGIDLVKRIHQTDPNGKIVFVTSHTDKGIEILRSGIQAFGFIEKDPDQRKMIREYTKYLKMAANIETDSPTVPYIELPLGIGETVHLSVPEISFVDSMKTLAHAICYHTFDGSEITVRDTIEHALELLGKNFIRCHRSVIVNKSHVVSLNNGLLKLSNGTTVSYAIGKRKEIMSACFSKEDLQ